MTPGTNRDGSPPQPTSSPGLSFEFPSHFTQGTKGCKQPYSLLGTRLRVSTGQTVVSPDSGSPLALNPEQPFWASYPHERLKAPRARHSLCLVPHHTGILSHKACEVLCHHGLKVPPLRPQMGAQSRAEKHGVLGTEVRRGTPHAASLCGHSEQTHLRPQIHFQT